MTKFERIIKALLDGGMTSTVSALHRAAADEARELFENIKQYQKRDNGKAAREAAEEFYAEEIAVQVVTPEQPTVDRMLGLRRFPVVWAVAEVIRTNNIKID